jgi:NAD(P)-dependent dehydrogenase (short-subunit alcohol dehydrogenase family)
MRLADKVALITGAAGPMGEAISHRFAAEGARLVLSDISARRLGELASALDPDTTMTLQGDALEEAAVDALASQAIERFGRIDILVNIVGGVRGDGIVQPFLESTLDTLRSTLEFNLTGIQLAAQRIVPGMIENGYGRIVNFASIAMTGEQHMAAYSAAKAGVAAMTRVMAIEFAPHVTVNSIAPSLIRTRVIDRMDPDLIETYRQRTLLKRLGEPSDIANAALFLASEEASFITGVNLPVSGGIQSGL